MSCCPVEHAYFVDAEQVAQLQQYLDECRARLAEEKGKPEEQQDPDVLSFCFFQAEKYDRVVACARSRMAGRAA